MNSHLGFGDRLAAEMEAKGPLCVGIDPHPGILSQWGLADTAQSVETFALTVLEACGPVAAVLKPQVALFERHGSAGLAALETLHRAAAEAGVMVIADAKRGDIGSTMVAYSDAWLGNNSPLATDSVTLSPYLGFESLRPAFEQAAQTGRGAFVLALTSNPEGKTVQHVGGKQSVAKTIIQAAYRENSRHQWVSMGPCGLVIGATVGSALQELGIELAGFNGPILAPGYGAQGASALELYKVFTGIKHQVLVNSSRGVLTEGPEVMSLRKAAERSRDELIFASDTT